MFKISFNVFLLLICFLSLDASGSFYRGDGSPRFPFFVSFVKEASPVVDKWKKKSSDRFYQGTQPLFPSSFKEFIGVFGSWKTSTFHPFLTEKEKQSLYKDKDKAQKEDLTELQNQKLQEHCSKDFKMLNLQETKKNFSWNPKEPSSLTFMKTFSQPI